MPNDIFTDAAGKVNITGVQADSFGNPLGNEFDLAKDGAFKGYSIAVLHLYTGESFDFLKPQAALKEKGFDIIRWADAAPPIDEFRKDLWKCCQLWVISNREPLLSAEHIAEIGRYFDAGHGVYVWGDNEPYFADANAVGQRILNATMDGNVPGDKTVAPQQKGSGPGFTQHLVMTGLNYLYEGVTIATVRPSPDMRPLVFGSASNLVTASYDSNGKRAIFDGGFTRLFCNWDTAGTGRYVKNAAAWLANVDQWGRHPHDAAARHLAGQVEPGKATPSLFFFNQAPGDLKIGGYWEDTAKGTIAAYDPAQNKVKEEPFAGTEHFFTVKGAANGIWTARATFKKPGKRNCSYVLSIEADG
jgi:hypothetical protein